MLSTMNTHVTRRSFLRGLGLLSTSAALSACSQGAKNSEAQGAPLLAIIHTNDSHGHDVEVKPSDDSSGNFSMAAVPALKAELEKQGYQVVIVDAGDATQGMPLVDIEHGKTAIAFMNSCGYDLMAVGNHEFDWGRESLAAVEQAAQFPLLSANILRKDSGELRFAANKVIELSDGSKAGFFGLTTPWTITVSNPNNTKDLTFLQDKELFDCAQAQVDELRKQGCDLVVCVGHLGNNTAVGNNTSKGILENVQGIDLFIDGHDHLLVEEEVAGTLLVETGCYMENIGVVLIEDGVKTNQPYAYGSFDGIDEATQAIIDQEGARIEEQMGVVLGTTPFLLDGERNPGVRTQETNLGDFCADAFLWMAGQELDETVDAAIINGGGVRITVEAGDISLMTVKSIMPYNNELSVVHPSGAQILEALEASCQGIGEGLALGAFPQVAGITFTLDAAVPYESDGQYPDSEFFKPLNPGSRVTITDVGGRGFDLEETYALAVSSFIAAGGDSYYVIKQVAESQPTSVFGFDYEAFSGYLVEGCNHEVPERYAEPQGRITITGLEQ